MTVKAKRVDPNKKKFKQGDVVYRNGRVGLVYQDSYGNLQVVAVLGEYNFHTGSLDGWKLAEGIIEAGQFSLVSQDTPKGDA